jgi:hypothetical protein
MFDALQRIIRLSIYNIIMFSQQKFLNKSFHLCNSHCYFKNEIFFIYLNLKSIKKNKNQVFDKLKINKLTSFFQSKRLFD